jgi:hypothetical protein
LCKLAVSCGYKAPDTCFVKNWSKAGKDLLHTEFEISSKILTVAETGFKKQRGDMLWAVVHYCQHPEPAITLCRLCNSQCIRTGSRARVNFYYGEILVKPCR